jgi:serine/threonine-protein kinase
MPPTLSFWLLMMFIYAMFIPNTWRRAAGVIGAIAVAPVLLFVGMVLDYPDVAAVTTVTDFAQHVLVMLVAGLTAVFGTHVISSLRREAFEARQLGQYRLIAPLGEGGMGEVYLAEHQMLKRPCAIKLIRPEKAGDPHTLARFEREVQMTARLSHWNTVEIYDYGRTADGTFFYVMEYLPGMSLESLLQRHGPLLYDVVKLLDFGLVKPAADASSARLTLDGAISGTPLFMSPEQARGLANLDARSDIYSLGAVVYNLLCGRPPFERSSPMEAIFAHAYDEVTPPKQLQAGVPADLEGVILRCLAKKPEDRFQDAESLDQALAACAAADQWTQPCAARWWGEQEQTTATREIGAEATV